MANVAMKSAFSRLVTAVSRLTDKVSGKANTADLARVATSGNYSDLNGASPYQLPQGTQGDTIAFYNGSWVKASFSGMNFSYDNQHSTGKYGILLGNSNNWGIVKLDAALSDTSTAAIQNKAVTAALNTKADASLLQAEQDARTGTDDSLLSLINALQSLVSTLETRVAALETKVQ